MLETTIEPVIDRILHVAIEVFAEHGFRDTTIREICKRANVNVASINYYFRSKEALYTQALSFAFHEANQLYPQDSILNKALAPEQRLSLFIDNFLHKLLDNNHLGLHSKLITREITDPTKALNGIIATTIAPQIALLQEIIQPILGNITNTTIVHRCLLSIFGQCLMFKHSRSIIDHLYPELIADDLAIKACAEHIAQFSLIALTQLAQQQNNLTS